MESIKDFVQFLLNKPRTRSVVHHVTGPLPVSGQSLFGDPMTLSSLIRLALRGLSQHLQSINLRAASRDLERMPDYLLKDIGISRSSISYVVGYGRNEITIVTDRAGEVASEEPSAASPKRTLRPSAPLMAPRCAVWHIECFPAARKASISLMELGSSARSPLGRGRPYPSQSDG
jgi:uncharacterized protein YjiS (DUF1127 family)